MLSEKGVDPWNAIGAAFRSCASCPQMVNTMTKQYDKFGAPLPQKAGVLQPKTKPQPLDLSTLSDGAQRILTYIADSFQNDETEAFSVSDLAAAIHPQTHPHLVVTSEAISEASATGLVKLLGKAVCLTSAGKQWAQERSKG